MNNIASLAERDGDLVNNWYIVCLREEVGKKPIRRIVYDKAYVIYKTDSGKLVCLEDRCLHRHTKLSEGWCEKNQIFCPYHGWSYNEEGEVTNIPSEGNKFDKKYKLKKVHQFERDDALWIWTGEGEPESQIPPWEFPKFNDQGWVHYYMITDFDNEVTNLAENYMDVPHTVFVHAGWFRDKALKKVPMSVETKNGSVLVTYDQENDKIGGHLSFLLNPNKDPMVHTDKYIYPNITRVDYTFGEKYGFIINSQITPVSTLKSRVFTYISYRLLAFNQLIKPFIHYYTRQVINQDVVIMRNQYENLKLDFNTRFHSTDADEVHIAIERLRNWGVKGKDKIFEFENIKQKEFWI